MGPGRACAEQHSLLPAASPWAPHLGLRSPCSCLSPRYTPTAGTNETGRPIQPHTGGMLAQGPEADQKATWEETPPCTGQLAAAISAREQMPLTGRQGFFLLFPLAEEDTQLGQPQAQRSELVPHGNCWPAVPERPGTWGPDAMGALGLEPQLRQSLPFLKALSQASGGSRMGNCQGFRTPGTSEAEEERMWALSPALPPGALIPVQGEPLLCLVHGTPQGGCQPRECLGVCVWRGLGSRGRTRE